MVLDVCHLHEQPNKLKNTNVLLQMNANQQFWRLLRMAMKTTIFWLLHMVPE